MPKKIVSSFTTDDVLVDKFNCMWCGE